MVTFRRSPRAARPRIPASVAIAAAAAVAVAATSFLRSFTALAELATDYGVPLSQAWTIPVAVDGLVIVATVSAAVSQRARGYAWFLLIAGTVLSVAGNGIHAWELTSSVTGVGIAVVPPIVTLAAVHLTIELARQNSSSETATAPDLDRDALPVDETPADSAPRPVSVLRIAPDVAPTATATVAPKRTPKPRPKRDESDDELRDEALRLVVSGLSLRATGEQIGVSKDKVHRWVKEHKAQQETAAAAS